MTIGEICKGIDSLPSGQRRDTLQRWFDSTLRAWYAGRVLPVTDAIAERWGHMSATAKRHGVTLAVVDGVIAATAIEHNLTLVTRNVNHFDGLGISLLNLWEAA